MSLLLSNQNKTEQAIFQTERVQVEATASVHLPLILHSLTNHEVIATSQYVEESDKNLCPETDINS